MAGQAELEALVEKARKGELKPLVLLYGDQDYLVRQAYDRLCEAWVPVESRDFNFEQHDGTRAEPQALLDSLATPPMLPGPKAVAVYDARYFASKSNAAEILLKAKERWAAGDQPKALRELGRVLALAESGWDDAAQAGPAALTELLELNDGEAESVRGPWLAEALQTGASQGLGAVGGDDAGILAEGLEAMLGQWNEGALLICACLSADQRKRLTKLFLEKGHVLAFKKDEKAVGGSSTPRAFLRKALDDRKLKTSNAFNERLLAAYGGELGELERELDKLAAYAWPALEIGDAELAAVGSPRPEEDVFKLVDALGKKDLGSALRLVRELGAADKGAPFQILGLMISELRLLVALRALMDEGKLPSRGLSDPTGFRMQVHPKVTAELPPALGAWWKKTNSWRLFFALKRAAAFKTDALHALLKSLADGDIQLKSGQCGPLDLLEEICVRSCGGREEVVL